MTHSRSFIRYLRKICFILLLTLTFIMLAHILITLFLSTYIDSSSTKSSPIHIVISVFLYYVIPLIVLLFFYLIFNGLTNLEPLCTPKKQTKKQYKKQAKKTDKIPDAMNTQAKKKAPEKQSKKQALQSSCYKPLNKLSKKNEE